MVKDFISLADFTGDEILGFLDLADKLKKMVKDGAPHPLLHGKTLALIFEKASLRTRLTFQIGMYQLGGKTVLIDDVLGRRESVADMAHNLERWVDGIMARTYRHDHVVEMAGCVKIPVINALTDLLHPCQILADVQALREHKGHDLGSLKVAFVGDGNNVFHSWANFARRVPLNLTLVCPPGYEGNTEIVSAARREAKGEFVITHDVEAGRARRRRRLHRRVGEHGPGGRGRRARPGVRALPGQRPTDGPGKARRRVHALPARPPRPGSD